MKKLIFLFSVILSMTSCIKNDIPYPVVKGEVLEFEAAGQTSATINNETRVVTLVLGENVDMSKVELKKFKTTENSTSSIVAGQQLNVTEAFKFTITTYQDWEWTIQASQPISREVLVRNQVGMANIDVVNRVVTVEVTSAQSLSKIEILSFKLSPTGSTYIPEPTAVKDFTKPVRFTAKYAGKTEEWIMSVTQAKSNVTTLEAVPWGGFAMLSGSIAEGSTDQASFEYRKSGDAEWKSIPATVTGASISARLGGLTGATDYEFRAVQGQYQGAIVAFKTEATPSIPNMGLDEWALKGKTWFPNATADYSFWATGNEGVTSTLAGGQDSNTFPTDDAVKGKAACIKTISAPIVDLAAGNLFCGSFKLNIMKPLDSPSFSKEYSGRPTKLNFYYKYQPKTIDVAKNKPDMLGKMDRCHVYIYLGDWTGELKSSQLKGEQTNGIIALGEFVSDKSVNEYTLQSIDIKYLDTKRMPTRIAIVASSSYYGELYTGGVGSTLFLDEMSFSFD